MPSAALPLMLASMPFGPLIAQEPRRETAFGEIRDAGGRPFAGATLHLLYRAHPAVTEPAYGEHLQATADDRGRFRANVLAGMPYTAWAEGPGDAPRWRCTRVVHDVATRPANSSSASSAPSRSRRRRSAARSRSSPASTGSSPCRCTTSSTRRTRAAARARVLPAS
jgi:hypothetical protein